jgi:plasmid maintenance system antidote protein VapI
MSNETRYNPNGLLDALLAKKALKNDAALARELKVAPPVISKIRHGRLPVGARLILTIHETFDMPVRDIRAAIAA